MYVLWVFIFLVAKYALLKVEKWEKTSVEAYVAKKILLHGCFCSINVWLFLNVFYIYGRGLVSVRYNRICD